MPASADFGRVFFPGNPWPLGHRIVECVWTARIERSSGVWFDFHVKSEPYYAADKGTKYGDEDDNQEDDEDLDPTASRVMWHNFHSLTLSSTYWPGTAYGFQVGSNEVPFNFRKLNGMKFEFESPPVSERLPHAFCVYRWGHEAVGYHSFAFKKEANRSTFSITWTGKIGGFTRGKPDMPYDFKMKLKGVAFGGILFPPGTDRDFSYNVARLFVQDAHKYHIRIRTDCVALTPV